GSMDYDGNTQPKVRFPTSALLLRKNIEALRQKKRPIYLTMEAGAFTRWASAIARPLVERLIICEPRHNRLINSNPTKSDGGDVFASAAGQAQRSVDGTGSHAGDLPGAGL